MSLANPDVGGLPLAGLVTCRAVAVCSCMVFNDCFHLSATPISASDDAASTLPCPASSPAGADVFAELGTSDWIPSMALFSSSASVAAAWLRIFASASSACSLRSLKPVSHHRLAESRLERHHLRIPNRVGDSSASVGRSEASRGGDTPGDCCGERDGVRLMVAVAASASSSVGSGMRGGERCGRERVGVNGSVLGGVGGRCGSGSLFSSRLIAESWVLRCWASRGARPVLQAKMRLVPPAPLDVHSPTLQNSNRDWSLSQFQDIGIEIESVSPENGSSDILDLFTRNWSPFYVREFSKTETPRNDRTGEGSRTWITTAATWRARWR